MRCRSACAHVRPDFITDSVAQSTGAPNCFAAVPPGVYFAVSVSSGLFPLPPEALDRARGHVEDGNAMVVSVAAYTSFAAASNENAAGPPKLSVLPLFAGRAERLDPTTTASAATTTRGRRQRHPSLGRSRSGVRSIVPRAGAGAGAVAGPLPNCATNFPSQEVRILESAPPLPPIHTLPSGSMPAVIGLL